MAERICIVEDDESIQDMLKIILQRAGYELHIFPDGKAIMENNYILPDLFLLDKQLPGGIDGLDICRYLKTNNDTREIPAIMVSADPNIEMLSKEAGADGFVEKPFTMALLLKTIKTLIQKTVSFDNVLLVDRLQKQG